MNIRRLISWVVNKWVIGGAVAFAGLLFGLILLLLILTRPAPSVSRPATAIVVVLPAPTETPMLPGPTHVETATATQSAPPAPPPGEIAVGAYVQISGTGGDGLNVRKEPGLKGDVIFLALESEVFQVTEGPRQVDGLAWWYLVAPNDRSHQGWAASNYLTIVQNP